MSNTIYLYLKTHNVTGLKYLGKTVKDPYNYTGSGTRWINHLKKHGKDVSTEILYQTECKEEFSRVAIEYSRKLNIVESNDFANLMDEQGQGGVNSGSFKPGCEAINKGMVMPIVSEKKKEYWRNWRKDNPDYKSKWKINNYVKKPKEEWIVVDNISAINKKVIQCPHCDKVGNVGNMKRWHFDRCKKKK